MNNTARDKEKEMEKLAAAARRLDMSTGRARLLCGSDRWPGAERRAIDREGRRVEWWVPEGSFPLLTKERDGRLTEDEREEIVRRKHAGESGIALAREFGVNQSYPYRLVERYEKISEKTP
jgi:hypothetical protein